MKPVVSICVPNLNTLPFLPERFETIFQQTCQNWELLVYDSYSDDGAWDYISKLAVREPRMRIWQGPREGIYAGWNECVRQASGEYVYIATSDDTMPADCLEKLVAALDSHPECDIAHCRLRQIDEHGRTTEASNWWDTQSSFARSSGELLQRPHIRRAPFDGLLHLLGRTVYISITQVLIRRSLFDRIGLFESKWGSVGDFNWNMRAGLVANTVHVPETWGGWRIHPNQATSAAEFGSVDHSMKIQSMIEDAVTQFEKGMACHLRKPLAQTREFGALLAGVAARRNNAINRKAFVIRRLLTGSAAARAYVKAKLGLAGARPWPEAAPDLVRHWLEDAGTGELLVPL